MLWFSAYKKSERRTASRVGIGNSVTVPRAANRFGIGNRVKGPRAASRVGIGNSSLCC